MANQDPQNLTATEKALKKHFTQSKLPIFEDRLFNNIVLRVDHECRVKAFKPKLWVSIGVFIASLAMLVFAIGFSIQAYSQTPLVKYFSLIFTDFKTVADNWQDYSFSILENLPLGATTILLSVFLASLWLIDFATHQFVNFRKLSRENYAIK